MLVLFSPQSNIVISFSFASSYLWNIFFGFFQNENYWSHSPLKRTNHITGTWINIQYRFKIFFFLSKAKSHCENFIWTVKALNFLFIGNSINYMLLSPELWRENSWDIQWMSMTGSNLVVAVQRLRICGRVASEHVEVCVTIDYRFFVLECLFLSPHIARVLWKFALEQTARVTLPNFCFGGKVQRKHVYSVVENFDNLITHFVCFVNE